MAFTIVKFGWARVNSGPLHLLHPAAYRDFLFLPKRVPPAGQPDWRCV